MDETTTTEATADAGVQTIQGVQVDDQGQAVTQPEETGEATAATSATEETTQETSPEDEPSDDDDNSTAAWLKNKGIDPTSPEAIEKVAEMARNAEKAMHSKAQKASELEKAAKISDEQIPADATPEIKDNVRVRNLELKFDIQQWKMQNQDKLAHEAEMVKVLADPTKRALVQEGYLSLDDVYSIARAGNTEAVRSQGKKEALESLAHKQTAAVPRGNAVNTSGMGAESITPQNVDAMVARMSVDEYQKRLPEINKAMAG